MRVKLQNNSKENEAKLTYSHRFGNGSTLQGRDTYSKWSKR